MNIENCMTRDEFIRSIDSASREVFYDWDGYGTEEFDYSRDSIFRCESDSGIPMNGDWTVGFKILRVYNESIDLNYSLMCFRKKIEGEFLYYHKPAYEGSPGGEWNFDKCPKISGISRLATVPFLHELQCDGLFPPLITRYEPQYDSGDSPISS